MGAKGAAEIIFKKEIAEAKDPAAKLKEKEQEYMERFANPYLAAAHGYVDEYFRQEDTSEYLINSFQMIEN